MQQKSSKMPLIFCLCILPVSLDDLTSHELQGVTYCVILRAHDVVHIFYKVPKIEKDIYEVKALPTCMITVCYYFTESFLMSVDFFCVLCHHPF